LQAVLAATGAAAGILPQSGLKQGSRVENRLMSRLPHVKNGKPFVSRPTSFSRKLFAFPFVGLFAVPAKTVGLIVNVPACQPKPTTAISRKGAKWLRRV